MGVKKDLNKLNFLFFSYSKIILVVRPLRRIFEIKINRNLPFLKKASLVPHYAKFLTYNLTMFLIIIILCLSSSVPAYFLIDSPPNNRRGAFATNCAEYHISMISALPLGRTIS